MTIAGHDLVLAALTLPIVALMPRKRTIRTPAVSNRSNLAILATWLNITANR